MKLQITINDDGWEKIMKRARENGDDLNEVFRKALTLYLWVSRVEAEGNKVAAVSSIAEVGSKFRKVIQILDIHK